MIDTIAVRTARPLRPAMTRAICAGNPEPVPGWYFKWYVKWRRDANPTDPTRLEGTHEPTGLYVGGTAEVIKFYAVSLPRLLHGCNGQQLISDTETEQARRRAEEILVEISEEPLIDETLSRLDVAINLAHDQPDRLVLALRNPKHPWIRNATERYATGSVRFPGTEAVFTAYWKQRAKRSGDRRPAWNTPSVLRIELQLKNADKIASFLGHQAPPLPPLPTRAELYRAFCKFMSLFPRREQLDIPCTLPAVLALCESINIHLPGGESMMDWHRRGVSASGHAKMRRQVGEIVPQFLEVDWAQIFPSDRIPQTVDVFPDGRTAVVPEEFLLPPR